MPPLIRRHARDALEDLAGRRLPCGRAPVAQWIEQRVVPRARPRLAASPASLAFLRPWLAANGGVWQALACGVRGGSAACSAAGLGGGKVATSQQRRRVCR